MIIQYARRLFTRFLALPCSGHIPHINDVLDTLRFFVVKHALGLRFRQGDIQHQQPERLPRARWVRGWPCARTPSAARLPADEGRAWKPTRRSSPAGRGRTPKIACCPLHPGDLVDKRATCAWEVCRGSFCGWRGKVDGV